MKPKTGIRQGRKDADKGLIAVTAADMDSQV